MAKRALLVGVDVYPDPRNNLNSCVADTLAFKTMLQDTYQFDPASISLLHNQDATLANVRTGLETLFTGAHAGDELVYFESSHGYRYPEGNTMVEVLCLYDGFLKDTEFAERTQALPSNVLTVVLDSCHSGGLNKLFFPTGDVQVARAKVWQPTLEQAERLAQTYTQVTKFKFFGRATTGDTGAVAKNLLVNPTGVAPAKDLSEGAVDLNGALFAACLADQTAAAGSPATNNLSAFTYGIVNEVDTSLSLSQLSQHVGARLDALNMSQTPIAQAPPMHPELLTDTFITMQEPGGSPPPSPGGNGGNGFDPYDWLRRQLGIAA
jgi:Caspase domain